MNKKTHKKYVALLTMLAIICTMFCTSTAKADTDLPWDESEIAETSTCVVNGVERILIVLTNNNMYLKVGTDDPIYLTNSTIPYKFDKYGTLWCIETNNVIYWKSYDFGEIDVSYAVRTLNSNGNYSPIKDVESFIFDSDNKFVVGFKLVSGESYYTYTSDEIQSILASDRSYYPELRPISSSGSTTPTPTPSSTPTPTAPAATPNNSTPSAPTVSPVVTPPTTNIPTVTPATTVTPTPVVTPKISVKKKAGYNCLSLGSTTTSKYKLTKGKLTWKGSSKSKKYSGIKSAAFIKKSGNLVFMTKKGKVYTLSPKGKKKCIVNKNAKKLILKNKFAVKVQVGKKFINLANK